MSKSEADEEEGNKKKNDQEGNRITLGIAKKHQALEKIMNNMFYEFDGEDAEARRAKKEEAGKNHEKSKKSRNT